MTRSQTRRVAFVLALIGALTGCGAPKAKQQAEIVLASGKHLEVISEKFDSFVNVSGEPKRIYSIEYVTAVDMNNASARQEEAHEVLAAREDRIGKADYTTVILTPMKHDDAGGMEGYPMYFKRSPGGLWILERE